MNTDKQEVKITQAASDIIGKIVSEGVCAILRLEGNERSKPAAVRAACTMTMPALVINAAMVGADKNGRAHNGGNESIANFINRHSLTFAALLMVRMIDHHRDHSDANMALMLEFSPEVLVDAMEATEKLLGSSDDKIDPQLLEHIRETQAKRKEGYKEGARLLGNLLDKRLAH